MWQCLFDGIRISPSRLHYGSSDLVEWKGTLDSVSLFFNLEGRVRFHGGQDGAVFSFGRQQHNMVYASGSPFIMQNLDIFSESFMVQFGVDGFFKLTENTTDQLMRFQDHILCGKPAAIEPGNEVINLQLQKTIRDVLQNSYTGGMRKLYFLSKVIGLLVLQTHKFAPNTNDPYWVCKTARDKNNILLARDYLQDNLHAPPHIDGTIKNCRHKRV